MNANQSETVITGLHSETTESEVTDMQREMMNEIGMDFGSVKLACPATAVPWYPAILLPGALLLVSWFPLASWLPVFFAFCLWCCSESEDSVNNSRIQHSNCLWFMFDFLSLFT